MGCKIGMVDERGRRGREGGVEREERRKKLDPE
jgi:hypothetical protein